MLASELAQQAWPALQCFSDQPTCAKLRRPLQLTPMLLIYFLKASEAEVPDGKTGVGTLRSKRLPPVFL